MVLDNGYDLSCVEDARKLFDKSVFSSRGANAKKFDAMLQVFDRLWDERQSGIVSVPCSSSKTYSALIYAAALSTEMMKWGKKIWFVTEKIDDCKRNAEVLTALNVKALPYHGQPSTCTEPRKAFLEGCPCKACANPCGAANKYIRGLDATFSKCDVLCTTHKFFASELSKGHAINADLVIVDESPALLEQYELDENTIALISSHLSKADYLDAMFEHEVNTKIRDVLVDKGTHRIMPLDLDDFADAIKVAYINASKGIGGSVDKLEAALGFFSFFKYSTNVYGTATAEGKYRFVAGEVTVSIPTATVWILDGSARNQLTRWDGFRLIEVPELMTAYPHTRIKLLKGNSTKSALAKTTTRDSLTDAAKEITPSKTVLFSNKVVNGEAKKTVEAVEQALVANGCEVITMCRGEHVGSNRGREAAANLICMSLFSDVSDYALRASLYHSSEICEADIYGTQVKGNGGTFDYVKMGRGGFEQPQMRDVMVRAMERDLYQTVMRGCIRDDATEDYTVVAIVSEPTIIQTLADDLPGAAITCVGDEVITMWLDGQTVEDIAQTNGQSKQSVSKAIKAFKDKMSLND
jgi:hypothetical protein